MPTLVHASQAVRRTRRPAFSSVWAFGPDASRRLGELALGFRTRHVVWIERVCAPGKMYDAVVIRSLDSRAPFIREHMKPIQTTNTRYKDKVHLCVYGSSTQK